MKNFLLIHLITLIKKIKSYGSRVSLFIDPDENQIKIAKSVGAELVELHTGYYANSHNSDSSALSLEKLINAGAIASSNNYNKIKRHKSEIG